MTAPARLLSVRLQGFKSFADRTLVNFGPGISAVVGPNGSGKSNLADALRWALGEQGRALRSRKSEDVIWAGSERRPAVGMADVQLTLDNEDGLLPVEFGTVELGRRLYRSGENDYLLNRQRVRLKDLVDLLDAGHLAENAFLFIGQGMVDQALALRPEERRPLFEEVAGVRRHERRRRRAEEQLTESEANLARVDDILAELRPQARRLAQQAEQQANRRSAGDELVAAILLSAHARWHAAAARAAEAGSAANGVRTIVDAAMSELLELERSIAAAGTALAGQARAETEARSMVDRARAERATLQLREGRHASDLEAAVRERVRIEEDRLVAAAELSSAREALVVSVPAGPLELEGELARVEAALLDQSAHDESATLGGGAASAADAAAIRRLESARAQDLATARRRAADAEQHAAEELRRSVVASQAATTAMEARAAAAAELASSVGAEQAAARAREDAQRALAEAESAARTAGDRAAEGRAAATAIRARLDDAHRALEAAEGGRFSVAARERGGRPIADALTIEESLRPAVDAALAGFGRAQLLKRAAVASLADERGIAVVAETLGRDGDPDAGTRRFLDEVRARGGGPLVDAIRRDDAGAVRRLLSRVVWLPEARDCLELQDVLPAGWLAVARDGSVVAGEHAIWTRPDGRGLHLRSDVDELAAASTSAAAVAEDAATVQAAANGNLEKARTDLGTAREREATAVVARRRAEEVERSATSRAETASREAAWLAAQATRLQAEAARLRGAVPDEPPEPVATEANATAVAGPPPAAEQARQDREAALRRRRDELAAQVAAAIAARSEAERRRSQGEAAAALSERQLGQLARTAADLAEREGRLAVEREDLVSQLVEAEHRVVEADAALAAIVGSASADRDRLRAAEVTASSVRERLRIAQERARLGEREDLEARLAVEGLREQLLVELAGLGPTALSHLMAVGGSLDTDGPTAVTESAPSAGAGDDLDPEALEAALRLAGDAWEAAAPTGEPPTAARLATLRRRFHDLGAVNPFAADEYAEVRARLDGLEVQRSDLQGAIDHTRELITELDRLIGDQFRQTFVALEQAFDARFQQLFGGGFAKLSLTDPQDLSATGVDIVARPPGKKAQALAMLSGGERALTAVALLFAMLEVRPVPFCVLDEVDAALDEANIGRFTEALRDLARVTQCIVITHNRGTIETADALYGVTVGDDSVSRVISLRLDEATALARRPGDGDATALEASASLAFGPAGSQA